MKQVLVKVEASGEIVIEAVGFRGNACDRATEAFEKALGVAGGPKKRKPDFYQQQSNGQQVRQ